MIKTRERSKTQIEIKTVSRKREIKSKNTSPNAKPAYSTQEAMLERLKRLVAKQRQKGFDVNFISKTQPVGDIQFLENYVQTAKGVESILMVDVYPDHPAVFWLLQLTEASTDTVTIVNIESENKSVTRRRYQKMLREEKYAQRHARDDAQEMAAAIEVAKLEQLIAGTFEGESAQKIISIRLCLRSKDKESHQTLVSEVLNGLAGGGFGAALFSSDTKMLYQSKWASPEHTSRSFYKIAPHSVSSNDLAKGYPFNHTELNDPCGFYLGRTETNGAIFFDSWRRTPYRTASNMLILGKTGSGKSHFIKKNLDYQKALGNRIILFSKNNEYNAWTKDVGGVVVGMFSANERMNMMQVAGTATNVSEDGTGENTIDEIGSFTAHLAKIVGNLRLLDRTIGDTEANAMTLVLNQFYIHQGVWKTQEELNKGNIPKITQLEPEQYPTLSQLKAFIESDTHARLFPNEAIKLKMKVAIDYLVEIGGAVFDGPTRVRDLSKEQVICFDLDTLLTQDRPIQQIQLANAFNMIVSQALISGLEQRDLLKKGVIDEEGIMHTILLIDECHNLINIHNPFISEQVATSLRELRKLFGAVWLATQTPKEMKPIGNPQSKELITAVSSINKIVDFMTYKFLFFLDSETQEVKALIGDNLPDEYLNVIPKLKRGETVFMTGAKVLKMEVHYDPIRDEIYNGGQ